jgi:hypothetical protein
MSQHWCKFVGCGKSGLMALLSFGISQGRVLIVAPNVTIREGWFQAVDSASAACFWRWAGVAQVTTLGPFAAKLNGLKASLDDMHDSHYVVTNVQQLGGVGATVSPQPRRRQKTLNVSQRQFPAEVFFTSARTGICELAAD